MINKLESVIYQKRLEIAALRALLSEQSEHPIRQLLNGKKSLRQSKNFKQVLSCASGAVIAEIKRRSPSKGALATISNPVALAEVYSQNGANALSILTDETFFSGHLNDLISVAEALKFKPQPILRKDFILDEVQIAEAVYAGADAILAVVAVLKNDTKKILDFAKNMEIQVLVEIHDQLELEIAMAADAEIIGVNNRDLNTFEVNTDRAFELLEYIPKHVVKVAESGIFTPDLARAYFQAGFNAVLVGEALVTSSDPGSFIQKCR